MIGSLLLLLNYFIGSKLIPSATTTTQEILHLICFQVAVYLSQTNTPSYLSNIDFKLFRLITICLINHLVLHMHQQFFVPMDDVLHHRY